MGNIGLLALFLRQGKTYNKVMVLGLKNKQMFLGVLLASLLLGGQSPLWAQRGGIKKMYKRAAGAAARVYPEESAKKAAKLMGASSVKLPSSFPVKKQTPPSIEQLRRNLAELENLQKNLLEQKQFLEGQQLTRLAVFQAIAQGKGPVNTYSGTVFKTVYRGKEEVFGVIATHALVTQPHMPGVLGKSFRVAVVRDGQVHVIPAQVVLATSRKLLDIALVKFRPQDEALFTPLRLGNLKKTDKEVYSHGFACGLPATLSSRVIKEVSPWMIKTSMPLPKEDRSGLCGSAVLNARHELVGIHTGSTANQNPALDTGFAVPSSFLLRLVNAYHHDGKASLPLVLNGTRVAKLNVDEFVSGVQLLNGQGQPLWQKQINGKFSARQVEKQLKQFPQVRFIRLEIGKNWWKSPALNHTETAVLEENPLTRTVVFDWKNKKMLDGTIN